MLNKKICKHRVILLAIMIFTLSFAVNPIMFAKATVVEGVSTNPVPPGYTLIDFEVGVGYDHEPIGSHYPGLLFTSQPGTYWMWADVRSGRWNAHSLTDPDVGHGTRYYITDGYIAGFTFGDWGRIDFTDEPVNYFSVLVCTWSGVQVDAYDSSGVFLATSGWADRNIVIYHPELSLFTQLTIEAEGIAYVIIHDEGDYWWIDDIVFGRGIEATIDFDPDTLNRKSMGKWVTVYITLPEEYDVRDIDVDTILLNGVLSRAESSPTEVSDDGILMVKFDREDVALLFEPGETVVITISGELGDETFEGEDETISFIH